ncbi:MAG: sigma factor-like helix-turn-helix DNA-binding protein [Patescibacteria group bacterium]|nr:sigma factor-like helix-turn-helix DNA-binding protein [Patescibacteria group bacterium]
MIKDIDQFIEQVTADFNPKQHKVVGGRFGLKNGKKITLQEIGDDLGITRERVRQIEEQCLNKLAPRVKEGAAELINGVVAHLVKMGGVRLDSNFINDVKQIYFAGSKAKYLDQKLRFVFLTAKNPFYSREDDYSNAYWYADDAAKKKFVEFIKQMTQFFETSDRKDLIDNKTYLAQCRDVASIHLLSIPKNFGTNVFGDIGLREWPEIDPKAIRDKAYLVLRKYGKPFHFIDIAKHIIKYGIDNKPAHIQTVHNELIKDDRFVLVGRGIYGLRENGYEPGTVREVIARILKKKGALHSQEVVRLVNEQRILKENTILLGLQNRRYFKRLDDGRYHVKEV